MVKLRDLIATFCVPMRYQLRICKSAGEGSVMSIYVKETYHKIEDRVVPFGDSILDMTVTRMWFIDGDDEQSAQLIIEICQ